MTIEERKILETFEKVIPNLTDEQQKKLLWFGEGIAFKAEMEKAKQPA